MNIYPVIMCGGGGTRLWPVSRPSMPKQFAPLIGELSMFQETALRVAPLTRGGGRIVVIAGLAHYDTIVRQLTEVGITAVIMTEPDGRDSGPAVAAAALWILRDDVNGIAAIVASDHHIPDHDAFRAAVREAAEEAGHKGRIVTLGVSPTAPSAAYGYIKPIKHGLSPVGAFVEKPTEAVAKKYIDGGYLWNSGNFIVSARVMLEELASHAPNLLAAVKASLPLPAEGPLNLGPDFLAAEKVSIDIAVMEKTERASVLPVDFEWSDLGAWDAVKSAARAQRGMAILEDATECFVRAADGMVVAVMGVSNLAVIAERDAILVCALDRAQDVKQLVDRVRAEAPSHADYPAPLTGLLLDGVTLPVRARVSAAIDQLLAAKAADRGPGPESALWSELSSAFDEAARDLSRSSHGRLKPYAAIDPEGDRQ